MFFKHSLACCYYFTFIEQHPLPTVILVDNPRLMCVYVGRGVMVITVVTGSIVQVSIAQHTMVARVFTTWIKALLVPYFNGDIDGAHPNRFPQV